MIGLKWQQEILITNSNPDLLGNCGDFNMDVLTGEDNVKILQLGLPRTITLYIVQIIKRLSFVNIFWVNSAIRVSK